jgi:hypothetical protein
VKQCLSHPYFEQLHNEKTEPLCEKQFDWAWDNFEPTKELLQGMVYEQALVYHPEKKIKKSIKKYDKLLEKKIDKHSAAIE